MSEYQYYEFQAIDRPLGEEEMAELRRLSTRATITSTRFVNVYNYGDFRGDPAALMDRYFDAHFYIANWGTREFMLRLPRRLLDMERVAPYCGGGGLQARVSGDYLILDFRSDSEEPEGWVEGEGQLAGLLPVRAELAAGDLRALYLGWLASVQGEYVEEDDDEFLEGGADEAMSVDALEPPLPPGLGQPSAALRALAELLRLDDGLVVAAAEESRPLAATQPTDDNLTTWVRGLTESEKETALLRLLKGEGAALRAELLQQIRPPEPAADAAGRRTVRQLLAAAGQQRERQRREAAEADARRQREQAAARTAYLDGLVGHEPALWRDVDAVIEEKRIAEYDRAVQLLRDLRDLANRTGQAAAFRARLQQIRERYPTRSGLLRRLDEARLR